MKGTTENLEMQALQAGSNNPCENCQLSSTVQTFPLDSVLRW